MKRKLVLLGLLVLTSGSLFAQNTVKISGKVQFVGADKKVSVIQNNGFERITLGETEIGPDLFHTSMGIDNGTNFCCDGNRHVCGRRKTGDRSSSID